MKDDKMTIQPEVIIIPKLVRASQVVCCNENMLVHMFVNNRIKT